MKRMIGKLPSLLLAAVLAAGMAGTAFADVVYKDRDLSVQGAGEYTLTDLFDNFKDVMPGDKLDQPVAVRNDSGKAVRVYLRAEAHDDASNGLTYSEEAEWADGKGQEDASAASSDGLRDETVASMRDFLRQLHLTVEAGGAVVFDAAPDLEDQLAENVLLGEVPAGESLQLGAHLSVPIEMGNKYMHRVGEVDWVFTVEEIESAAPLSQTGDSSPAVLLAALACGAALAATAALFLSRRSRR